jgi:hypothetical protein
VRHWSILGWGGAGFKVDATGETPPLAGLEASYALELMDVGILQQAYQLKENGHYRVVPATLLRVEERFETRRGLDAVLAFGLGGAKAAQWELWYHIALGLRLNLGPVIIGGEVGFEQFELLRLAGCAGISF